MSNVELAKALGLTEADVQKLLSAWRPCLRCELSIQWKENRWVDTAKLDTCPDGFSHQG